MPFVDARLAIPLEEPSSPRALSRPRTLLRFSVVLALALTGRVSAAPIAEFRLDAVGANGTSLSEVRVGDDFFLQGTARDLRVSPMGSFSAYADVDFDAALATVVGLLEFGPLFPNGHNSQLTPGLLDEVGGVGDLFATNARDSILFRVPIKAERPGTLVFTPSSAGDIGHEANLYGLASPLRLSQISFVPAQVTIVPEPASGIALSLGGIVLVAFRSRRVVRIN